MNRPTITITDVARAAGVGVGTVSRVINNSGSVRPATAEVVRQAIARLGYHPAPPSQRPGPTLGKIRGNRVLRNVLLMILGEGGLQWILDSAPIYASVLHGLEAAMHDRGGNLMIRQATSGDMLGATLHQSRADAVIAFGDEFDAESFQVLQRRPAVWVMGSPQHFRGDLIQPDHMKIGVIAAEYALARGHRHGAYLGTSLGSPGWLVGERGTGFDWAMRQGGGRVEMLLDPAMIVRTRDRNAPDQAVLGRVIARLAAMDPRPTVLLLQADLLAPSVYRLLHEHGLQPQRDVTIITCNNERPYLAALEPQPVVVDLQAQTIGRRAVEALLWRAANPNEPTARLMVSPLLVEPDPPSPSCRDRPMMG